LESAAQWQNLLRAINNIQQHHSITFATHRRSAFGIADALARKRGLLDYGNDVALTSILETAVRRLVMANHLNGKVARLLAL
jgi:hypothetical protein